MGGLVCSNCGEAAGGAEHGDEISCTGPARAVTHKEYCDMGKAQEEDFDDNDEWACTFCGGDGYREVDDPLVDDCDEFGEGPCNACRGTGLRKNQTVF